MKFLANASGYQKVVHPKIKAKVRQATLMDRTILGRLRRSRSMDRTLAKFFGNLVGGNIQTALLFASWFVKQQQLGHVRLVEVADSKTKQANGQMLLGDTFFQQLLCGLEKLGGDIG